MVVILARSFQFEIVATKALYQCLKGFYEAKKILPYLRFGIAQRP